MVNGEERRSQQVNIGRGRNKISHFGSASWRCPITCQDYKYGFLVFVIPEINLSDLLIGHFYQIDRTRDKTA